MSIKLFNNVMVYRLTQPGVFDGLAKTSNSLSEKRHRDPGTQDLVTYGFIPPLGVQGIFAELIAPGVFYIAAKRSERMLPGKVVREAVKEKIDEIEKNQLRKVYAKERNQIKDEVVLALLPRAFITHKRFDALIAGDLIFIDTSSAKRAEDLLSTLREALGSLPVRPVTAKINPSVTMTEWARDEDKVFKGFSLGESFKSRATSDERSTLSGSGVTITEEDLHEAIRQRTVTELELVWHPDDSADVGFKLTEDLTIKGIRWPDEIATKVAEDVGEDEDQATIVRATLLILAGLLVRLKGELLQALGGEDFVEGLSDPEVDDAEDLV